MFFSDRVLLVDTAAKLLAACLTDPHGVHTHTIPDAVGVAAGLIAACDEHLNKEKE